MTEVERAIKSIVEHQQKFGKPIKFLEVTQSQFDRLKAETEHLRQYTFDGQGFGNSIMGIEIRVVDVDQLRTTITEQQARIAQLEDLLAISRDENTRHYQLAKSEVWEEANKRIARLEEALKLIRSVAPRDVECNNMHHAKKDQHSYDETCPVVSRYAEAINKINEVIGS